MKRGEQVATEAQNRANKKYDKKAYKKYTFRLRRNLDKEIIDKLERQPNKQQFIIEAIKKA